MFGCGYLVLVFSVGVACLVRFAYVCFVACVIGFVGLVFDCGFGSGF